MKYTAYLNSKLRFGAAFLGIVILWALTPARAEGANAIPGAGQKPIAQQRAAYGKLPLSFEANRGQTDPEVKFLSRGAGYALFLTPTEAVFVLREPDSATPSAEPKSEIHNRPSHVLRMKLIGANRRPKVEGLEQMPGKVHYFTGNDPAKWRPNGSTYARVRYHEVYPGIDMVYYGNQRQLEYDFVLASGADLSRLQFSFAGVKAVRVAETGELVLSTERGEMRQPKPVVYQEVEGKRMAVEGSYVMTKDGRVTFRVGDYDAQRPLIIDPVLVYSTYLGGSGDDSASAIAVDSSGNAYLTGTTLSTDFPTVDPIQGSNAGSNDVFVSKLNAEGSALLYSTYLGGSSIDTGSGIAVNSAGNAYITGTTISTDFPTTPNAFQGTFGGGSDAFVTKLEADGSSLLYSTYLGGSVGQGVVGPDETGGGIAVDSSGNAYVTGHTTSTDFPTTDGAFQETGGGIFEDVYVTKFNPDGSALVYSTYLGGSNQEFGGTISVDSSGRAYVTGITLSTDFPTVNAIQGAFGGGSFDAFVTKFDASGAALSYSTYLGGNGLDFAAIAVDSAGNACLAGGTSSTDFPTVNPIQADLAGGIDAFAAKLNPDGSGFVYSTYLGGNGDDNASGIAVDSSGSAYIAGVTGSTDFPTFEAIQATLGGGTTDAFLTKLNADASAFVYSTYLGGNGDDSGSGVAVDSSGNAYIAGNTRSTDFPTAQPFQPALGGGTDLFVAQISEGSITNPPTQPLNISTRLAVGTGDNVLIGGFILTGTDLKKVIIRAIGPSLGNFGVPDPLADPTLELHASDNSVVSNNNWKDTQQTEIAATGLAPTNDLESAIVATLDPGAYTAIVSGKNGGTGVALVEVYDLDPTADSQLANISTRGFVGTGDNVMIGGFIIGGGGGSTAEVLLRGIGSSLTDFGVSGALPDPTLELYDGNGTLLMSNDDWKDSQQREIEATGLEPSDDQESAILATLPPGGYTAIVRGALDTTGVGLVEVYNLP